ncbi:MULTISPECIES: hypothetical protein [unclassified Duganella]|uniref:hypothetical protein n=1 Tax=unclassified Duganella TaxID=2636909 RepID=UPI0008838A6C|nr:MULTISPECIES: hypothetical protein [unclassified Duganella]SDG78940.1 hypothetical protein SAMN05216320_10776 [Duganella sp. OV458]SDK05978.1 hypothetical protein SAMN05428973_10876 [Duganella sp. OV510]
MPVVLLILVLLSPGALAQQTAWLWDEARLPAWSTREAAVLQRHILLSGDDILLRPRKRWPALPPSTLVTPVMHVEVSTVNPPVDIEKSRAIIVSAMMDAAARSSSGWVQLDMEAKPSQRVFYRSLVQDIRTALPPQLKLSVTALAWWCRAPAWLDGLAADEVVPMFFRMGKDSAAMRAILEQSPATLHASCRAGSAGFSPQEPFARAINERYAKNYWFDRYAWKRDGADQPPLSRSTP